jgi:hypothetical protein
MPSDIAHLRDHARRCWLLAAQTDNPVLKRSLVKAAQRSMRLALDLAPKKNQVIQSTHASAASLQLSKLRVISGTD